MHKNSEMRQRKVRDQNGRPLHKKKYKHNEPTKIHQSFLSLIICGVVLTLFIVFYFDHIPWHMGHRAADSIAQVFGYSDPVHAVVIDAGSTGSRVLAFTFHRAYLNNELLLLDKELFVHTKPGLSAFADDPQKAVDSISSLIDKAKAEIPDRYWAKTPIILKATAGLRLLPPKKADGLLQAVRNLFERVPFRTDDDSVSIMDGTDEGIFSWFTVNFLLNIVDSPSKTVAALDLGGGSTQVTFSAQTPATLQQREFVHDALLPLGTTPVYTNSYLGLGLMAARKEIITLGQGDKTHVESLCVNTVIKDKKYHYGGVDYLVSGLQKDYATLHANTNNVVPIVDFKACSKIVKEYVMSKAKTPVELSLKKVFAFSYYFDRAAEAGLIDESTGGSIVVEDFKTAAKTACLSPNTEQPFMCLDLTFISILLEDGLGLDPKDPIYLYKKIRTHEISWALGAAFNMLKGLHL